jgi:hypothetical protein
MYCIADVFDGWEFNESLYGTDIVRPFLVYGLNVYGYVGAPPSNSADAPRNIIKDCPGLPQIYDQHPTLNYCLCVGHKIRLRNSATSCFVDCIYRSSLNTVSATKIDGVVWTVTDTPQTSQVNVTATSDSSTPLAAFYMAHPQTGNESVSINGVDAGTSIVGGNITTKGNASIPGSGFDGSNYVPASKYVSRRTVNCKAAILGSFWKQWQPLVDACRGKINQSPWGPGSNGGTIKNLCQPRGYWYFNGAQTTTNDFGQTFTIDMNFFGDDRLWYSLLCYTDATNYHPYNCSTEADVRAAGPPDVGKCIFGNGLTLASTQSESDFSIFTF